MSRVCAGRGMIEVCAASFVSTCAASAVHAGTPPASLVGIQWSVNGSVSASTQVACEQGCADTSNCTVGPDGTSLAFSGSAMTATNLQAQPQKNCFGVCGGAAMLSSFGSFGGSALIIAPTSGPSAVVWAIGHNLTSQAGAGAGQVCGVGSASGSCGGTAAWDLEFDTAPGLTLLTISRQHVARIGSHSEWTVTRQGGAVGGVFSETLPVGDIDTGFGVAQRVLTQGRYRVRIDAQSNASASASVMGSQNNTTTAYLECSFALTPYLCAGVSTSPQDRAVCPSGMVSFFGLPSGSDPTLRWQWEPADLPGQWFDMVEGVNTDAGAVARFEASGVQSATVVLNRHNAVGGGLEAIRSVRLVSSNLCGDSPSAPGVLTVCRGDFNCDGSTNTADLTFFLGRFGAPSPDGGGADINHDGAVNTADLTLLLGRFGQSCG